VGALLNTADMAILLTASTTNDAIGMANYADIRMWDKKPPTAWSAAVGKRKLNFVHELGHLMGAMHNREELYDIYKPRGSYNYGFLIRNTPYHTIMSYSDRNREKEFTCTIPYFSMDVVDSRGIWFGNKDNNNARQLTDTRLVLRNENYFPNIWKVVYCARQVMISPSPFERSLQ
jgi:hypothetical protein